MILCPVIGRAGLYIFVLVGFSFLVLFENSDFDIRFKKIKIK